jgi:hypothetical protein
MRLYTLYKMSSNKPEFTGDIREEIKGKHTHQHTRREERRSLRESSETVAGHESGRDPARGITGVIEQPWSAKTQPRHSTVDVVEG